jgi:aspartyl-tRNA synthetase
MKRTYIKDLASKAGEEVSISCWIDVRRDQGKMVFFDFRDMTGYVQGVVLPMHAEAIETAKEVRPEWVVEIKGKVNARPPKNVQADKQNGAIELEVLAIKILNKAETPAFDVRSDGKEIGEDVRLKYRYLDLRRPRMQKNLRNRHKVIKMIRDELSSQDFIEVETPNLTKSTPEGSRDFIVPSRLEKGHFYALPQSPQQYKQLLMTAGVEKYFQIARCFRDEDTRGDRQPEFTQLDLEMSFPTQEEILQLNEALLIKLVTEIYPHKKIQQVPFPRLTYAEAMSKYNSDKPDIREDKNNPDLLAFCWVLDFPMFEKTDDDKWTFTHNPFSGVQDASKADLMAATNIEKIMAVQYDVALNGSEIGGGSIRNHEPEALKKVLSIMGHSDEKIEANFGHMLKALGAGTPPHGGIAWGLDRLMMILENEPNIREVIPFAKTGEGRDLMMESPSSISEEQLGELGIEVSKE